MYRSIIIIFICLMASCTPQRGVVINRVVIEEYDTTGLEAPEYIPDVEDDLEPYLSPENVPMTYPPWNYRGYGSLKDHLHEKHNIPYELMVAFKTDYQIKKLHYYMHNMGDKNGLRELIEYGKKE